MYLMFLFAQIFMYWEISFSIVYVNLHHSRTTKSLFSNMNVKIKFKKEEFLVFIRIRF